MIEGEFDEMARDWGVGVEEAKEIHAKRTRRVGGVPLCPPAWWGPNQEEEALMDQGLLDPRQFSLETSNATWEFIPLRDPDGDIIPFEVRRAISASIGDGQAATERTKCFIAECVEKWANTKRRKRAEGEVI